jgi:hypothetical protein
MATLPTMKGIKEIRTVTSCMGLFLVSFFLLRPGTSGPADASSARVLSEPYGSREHCQEDCKYHSSAHLRRGTETPSEVASSVAHLMDALL